MKTLVQESLAFIEEAFGKGSVALEGSCPLPAGLSLQVASSVEALGFQFLGTPGTLIVVSGLPKTQHVLALAAELKSLPAPRVFAIKEADKELAGLLVANDVAHIIPGRKLFIPELGLLFKNAPARQERWRAQNATRLSATGRQAITCALLVTDTPWQQPWKPMELRVLLQKLLPQAGLSAASHTRLLAELVDLGFGESTSGGPHKRFSFFERDELWRRLLQVQAETILRKVRLNELPHNPVYAGNQALSRLSRLRLTEDEPIEIALSQKEFDSLPHVDGRTIPARFYAQIWRNQPALTKRKNGEQCVNIVDLALTKRNTNDPREREVLYELLQAENLSPEPLMETL